MNKIFQLLLIIIFFSGCSFNKNSKFWTSETIKEIEEQKFEKIFDDPKALSQELNTNINLNLSKNFTKNKLSVKFTNNDGRVNFDGSLKKSSKYKFSKIDYSTGGPARFYTSDLVSNKIGFISPLTNNFCASCNRVRISSTGKLFMCLGQNDFVDFREIMRKDYSDDYIKEKIKFALNIKPKQHDFMIGEKINKYMKRHMNVTGG